MKKLLKVHFYGDVVIDAELAEGLSIFAKLVPVETNGYNKSLKAVPTDKEIEFTLIDDKQFIRETDEAETVAFYKQKAEQADKNYNDCNSDRWKAQEKARKLEEELKALKEVCPHKPEEDEDA
jgi:hypothetical protein